jgi:NAD/NADP transhydrogenase beta subunit
MAPELAQILSGVGVIIGAFVTVAVGMAARKLAQILNIKLSDQQVATIDDAAEAIADALKVIIAQGGLTLAQANDPKNSTVQNVAHNHVRLDVEDALRARDMTTTDLVHLAHAKIGKDTHFLISFAPQLIHHRYNPPTRYAPPEIKP